MSEYQYYEFRAIDRPLTKQEMAALRAISSRAEITPTSFVNTYEWGNFKGDPDAFMQKYFDAFVYVANWGTHRFVMRVPRWALNEAQVSTYCPGESASALETSDCIVLDYNSEDEAGDWEEGEGYMASLIPLRAELMQGDLRCLYLGWLLCAQCQELDEGEMEPPVPPGLAKLSAPLQEFANFLRIEEDLIEVAAESSDALEIAGPSEEELAAWIAGLPESKKDALLLEAVAGNKPHFRVELLRLFEQHGASSGKHSEEPPPARRTVSQLLDAARARTDERERREAERKSAERAKREREEAVARAKYLEALAGREKQTWLEVDELIQTKQPKKYDQAVDLLVDLRDLALEQKREGEFNLAFEQVRARHASKPSFLQRLHKVAKSGVTK